jgi:hypothetical protein
MGCLHPEDGLGPSCFIGTWSDGSDTLTTSAVVGGPIDSCQRKKRLRATVSGVPAVLHSPSTIDEKDRRDRVKVGLTHTTTSAAVAFDLHVWL